MAYKYNPLLKSGLQEMPAADSGLEYQSGVWYTASSSNIGVLGWSYPAINIVYGEVFEVYGDITVSEIAIDLSGAADITSIWAGIYNFENGVPTTLISRIGTPFNPAVNAVQTSALQSNAVLKKGWYVIARTISNGTFHNGIIHDISYGEDFAGQTLAGLTAQGFRYTQAIFTSTFVYSVGTPMPATFATPVRLYMGGQVPIFKIKTL